MGISGTPERKGRPPHFWCADEAKAEANDEGSARNRMGIGPSAGPEPRFGTAGDEGALGQLDEGIWPSVCSGSEPSRDSHSSDGGLAPAQAHLRPVG